MKATVGRDLRYQAVKINAGVFGWAVWDYIAQRCLRPGSSEGQAKQYAAKLNRANTTGKARPS